MPENLPSYVSIFFILATVSTLALFYTCLKKALSAVTSSKSAIIIIIALILWLAAQGVLAWNGFYTDTKSLPPKFLLAAGPPLIMIIILFATNGGRSFIRSLPVVYLTNLSVVRILVELVIYWLYLFKAVPELMTFAGRNYDILAGITAPFFAYFGLARKRSHQKIVLMWHIIALGLLLNIVINALLSAPFPFQQFAFERPNLAVFYFPFIWLPSFIVPVVLFTHLVSIWKLVKKEG